MNRRVTTSLIAVCVVVGVAGGVAAQTLNGRPSGTPTRDASPQTTTSTAPQPGAEQVSGLVRSNRSERQGPSWSPADPEGPDGKPLVLGNIVPAAVEPVRVGDPVEKYVRAGLVVEDLARESSCEGKHYRWAGQWAEGMDLLVDPQGRVSSIGVTREGPETPEGIAIGNSFRALMATYDSEVQFRESDYGQAGAFVRGNGGWIGFGFDVPRAKLTGDSRITFIEVSKGRKPGMIRDGC